MRAVLFTILLAASACAGDGGAPDLTDGGRGPDGGGVDGGPPPAGATARYPSDTLRSPVTASVVDRMVDIDRRSGDPNDAVFMKVGASGTVNSHFLQCFSGDDVVLDGRDDLQQTIDDYNAPEAAGATSWERETLAAEVGRSAGWALSGDPSPLDQEIAAVAPRVAVVNYGTNDMQLGSTYESALWPFHENLATLLDQLEDQGIVPVVTGLNPRSDSDEAARWVPTYNTVTRAMAEARQIPYINLYRANVDLPAMGLGGDGIHGNVYVDGGSARPCVFTPEALQFNYNLRNLLTLQTFDDVRRTAIGGAAAPDADTPGWTGTGAPDQPFEVDRLPFTHHADTARSENDRIDAYPACESGQDESGPELFYRLEIAEATPVRILVLDRGDVDVDLQLLRGSPEPSECIARAHRIIERTLAAGTYYVVVDSFVDQGGGEHAGPFSLAVLRCEPGDARCGA